MRLASLARLRDAAGIAVRQISRHPVRSGLGALTAAVAIAVTVTTMALIAGSREVVAHDMRALGGLTVQVHADPLAAARGVLRTLGEEELAAVEREVGGLAEEVVPARIRQFSATGEREDAVLLPVVATRPGYLAMYESEVIEGRWLSPEDLRESRPVAVLDAEAARVLFGRLDVVGERVDLRRGPRRLEVEVVGVLSDPISMREQLQAFDTSRGGRHVVARLLTFQNVHVPLGLLPEGPYTAIFVRGADRGATARIQDALLAWAGPMNESGLFVWSRGEWIDAVLGAIEDLSVIGNVIWMLVLLVAIIMIMVVTMVTVRERFPEVAIRRTEGASRGAIVAQFTVEGMIVCVTGGVGGLLLGRVSAGVLADMVGWPPAFHAGDLLLALGLALLVGLAASILPARRAAKLDPVAVLSRRRL
jgi:putative ABC transport system permease protein